MILIFIFLVFILADYKVLKAFFEKEKDRNIAFTNSQYESYMNSDSENKISEEFIKEVLEDMINNVNPDEVESSEIEENEIDVADNTYDNF